MDAYAFWRNFDRFSANKTLKAVTEIAGVNYRTIKNQRSAVRLPNLDDAYALAKALKVSLDALLTGEEVKALSCKEAQAVERSPELQALVRAIIRDPNLLRIISAVIESSVIESDT